MKLYLDTSALVKLYVEKEGSATVREAIARAETVATTVIAYVEACAAFARRRHEGRLSRGDYRRTIQDLQSDWDHSLLLEVPVNSFEGRRIWQRCTLFGPMMRCI